MVHYPACGNITSGIISKPDIVITDASVSITVDLRGVKEVEWFFEGNTLVLQYKIGKQKIVKHILLPVEVDTTTATSTLVNDVLDIEVKRC